ncbi:MAG: oligosaccharide flippase family protein [Eubacteriales bacterium]|nr:oligosaccharide flippase family protein [Eubacteriales bacterium]
MGKKNSRTTNTLFNFTSSMGGQFVTIVMQFITRTVFISTLGKSYLGINGLFSNILTMLSLAEFGVGSAILFKLYEPIARDDRHRIAVLMKFYKDVYRIIGIAVAGIGVCLIPFLPFLINDYDKLQALHINAVLIFILYLLKSVSSYLFFAYKSAIVKANQKEYLINVISYGFTIGSGLVQIIFLLLFENFQIYVLISVISVIAQNIACARLSDKMYPYINEKTDDKVSWSEVKGIFKDCAALFLYKLNNFVLKATDNIILSKFIGLEIVGVYSNYYIFYTTIRTLFNKVFNSVSHSLGNLHTGHNKKHEYQIFEAVDLITIILGGTTCVGVFIVANEFVLAWIGTEWVLPQPFSLLMGMELYTLAIRLMLSKYRTTMGLFQQAKYRPVAGMIINLIVSITLVNHWGICGVLVGTITADWTTYMWYDPMIIHKYGFGESFPVVQYYIKNLKYLVIVALIGAVDWMICTHILTDLGWISVIAHAMICAITVPVTLIAISVRTPEGQYVYKLSMGYVRKITKKLLKRG